MNLNLQRPMAFIDLETTGINVSSDRIVEISILKIMEDGQRHVKTRRVNPGIPIPAETSAIHGIYDDDVKDEPTFQQIAKSLYIFIDGCDLGGFNSNRFDIPLLEEEFLRADIHFDSRERMCVDVQNIFHKMEQRTLVAAYKFYCDKDLEGAHSAEVDITATYEVLEAQIARYEELQGDVQFLHDFSKRNNALDGMNRIYEDDDGKACFNFGKHKEKAVLDVFAKDPSYYAWMMKGDFALSTKRVLSEIWEQFKS